jgi:hypothetical protein
VRTHDEESLGAVQREIDALVCVAVAAFSFSSACLFGGLGGFFGGGFFWGDFFFCSFVCLFAKGVYIHGLALQTQLQGTPTVVELLSSSQIQNGRFLEVYLLLEYCSGLSRFFLQKNI